MDEGQDFLSLGLDVSGFDERKKAILREYIQLFEQLVKFDGKTINPILGPGLAELNSSISSTNKILSEINARLSEFTTSTTTATNAVRASASASKILTDEQAKEKVLIAEINRLKIEQAKSENILTQSRINAKNAIKEQFEMESQLAAEARASSALIQAMMKKEAKAEEDLAKQYERDSKVISAMRKKDAAERQALIKKEAQAEEEIALQNERDRKTIMKLMQQQQAESKRSVAQSQKEQAANKALTNDYYLLTQALKDQAVIYSNLFINKGAKDPATKQALKDYGQTAAIIGQIDKKLESAQPKAFGLGKGLSSIYNQVRIIAYILPGIGIAGVFNLAYEAIGKAVSELGAFNDREKKFYDSQVALNEVLKNRLSLYDDLIKKYRELREQPDIGGVTKKQITEFQNSEGYDAITLLNNRRVDAERTLLQTSADVLKQTGNSPETLKLDLDRRLSVQQDYVKQITELDRRIALAENQDPSKTVQKDIRGRRLDVQTSNEISKSNLDLLKKQKEFAQSKLDISVKSYEADKSLLDKYTEDQQSFYDIQIQLDKARKDDILKRDYEFFKNQIDLNRDKNEKILDSDLSTEKQKEKAIADISELNKNLNNRDRDYILTDISSTQGEKDIAIQKARILNEREEIKEQIALLKLREDYRQRRLEAQKNIDKQELESSAITNERIYQNDKNSLDERLDAYVKYVYEKQKIQDIEYQRDIDVLRLKATDKNGNLDPTVALEIKDKQANRDAQKVAAQANVEKQVYDIVSSSYERQFKLVKDANESESQESKKEYTKRLNDLNDNYDKRIISYRRYKKELDKINKSFTTKGFDDSIEDDIEDIQRLTNLIESEQQRLKSANDKVDVAKIGVDTVSLFGGDKNAAKKKLDEATGEQEAITDAIEKATKERTGKEEKLAEDELKRAKSRATKRSKQDIDWYMIAERVERQLYESIKSFADKQYEYRVRMVQKQKELIDEQYEYERNAIEKSSLTAKDKAALDIQLQAQKREYDKKAQLDENKIKIEQAQFDKKLAIMHIILSTAMAVMAFTAKANVAGAIAAGVTGAIELGIAASTPIPSFAEGVEDFKGGVARYGEAGMEVVKEPGKKARLVMTETISYLPKGTDIIPVKDSPVFEEKIANDGWDQTLYLAKEIRRSRVQQKNTTTLIKINLGFENYKKRILGNG